MPNDNPTKKLVQDEHIAKINLVTDFIENNIDRNLTLDELARVATFSKFHFHRIFRDVTGETLFQFIQRVRVEKAASMLLTEAKKSITEISIACGFVSPAHFSRRFKSHFQMTPTQWRQTQSQAINQFSQTNSNYSQVLRNYKKASDSTSVYSDSHDTSFSWRQFMTETNPAVTIEDFAETAVIYLRFTGGQGDMSQLFDGLSYQLYNWAAARNLVDETNANFFVIYHDDPELTAVSNTRISICLPIPVDTKVEGEIGKMTIPAGKLATLRLETAVFDLQSAWDWVFNEWLPNSGFTFDDRPYFERYPLDQSYANNKYTVDICVPVKPF